MTYAMRDMRLFIIMAFCLHSMVMVAAERSFNPYASSSSSFSSPSVPFSVRYFDFKKITSGMSDIASLPLLVFLNKSFEKASDGYEHLAQIIADNPKQAKVVAATALVLAVMWYKSEAMKNFFKSERFANCGNKIIEWRDSAVKAVDDKLIANIPYPVYPVVLALRKFVGFLFNRIIAMEGEYVVGACASPLIGYINSYTPFAGYFGVRAGVLTAGMLLGRGWMGIDAAEVKRAVEKVAGKVDGVQTTVESGQRQAAQDHEETLGKIKDLNGKIEQLSVEIKQEIETSNKNVTAQIESSAKQAEESRDVLKQNIEKVHGELLSLAGEVSKLPSKQDNQNLVDEAMAKAIEKFEKCVTDSVGALDKKTEVQLEAITQQLKEGFNHLGDQQSNQTEQIKNLSDQFTIVLDEREKDIKALTTLVDSTKLSNKDLLEKFEQMNRGFSSVQEVLRKNDEKYDKLLDEKREDWNRLEKTIADQIEGFGTLNEKLSALDNKIGAVDQKVDHQYGVLMSTIASLKEELAIKQKLFEEERKQEQREREELRQQLREMKEAQKQQNENMTLLRNDLKSNAEKVHKGQTEILDAIKSGQSINPQITFDLDDNMRQNRPPRQNKKSLSYSMQQSHSNANNTIDWPLRIDKSKAESRL